jgi:hypothetical protein
MQVLFMQMSKVNGLKFRSLVKMAHNSLIREPIVSLWAYQTSPSVSL